MRSALVGKSDMYINTGSVFVPDARLRMNVIPIVLNVMIPFFLFMFFVTLSTFRFRHDHGNFASMIFWITTL